MNLLWIAALAILVLFEKLAPIGRLVARLMGLGFIVCGVWLLIHNVVAQRIVPVSVEIGAAGAIG